MTQRAPVVPLACTAALASLLLCPRVNHDPLLAWSVGGAALALLCWELGIWWRRRAQADGFSMQFTPIRSHWVQACVQFGIILWWGRYWDRVYTELPLVLAQVLYLYSLEALISWSRGRAWRIGFGPLPIIFSTNLLLWFRDEWFFLQFAMVTLGVMGKQFMNWRLPERTGHIFNPSAFGQTLIAFVLIGAGLTLELTWGAQIAATFEVPYMLVVIFLGGLVVQALFHVTLMTLAAAATLCVVNLVYTHFTGVYFFVNVFIAAPIFLGIHLLITDPSTSPKTYLGRVVFGSAYALAYCVLFRLLDMADVPAFWDKLLPVPFLNLMVPFIDRACRAGWVGRLNARWESAASPAVMNVVHMGAWCALFGTMLWAGYAYGPHPGDSIPFWQQAVKEGKPYAERSLAMAVASQAVGQHDAAAYNELGLLSIQGKGVPQSNLSAAESFAKACEGGDLNGCENLAIQAIFLNEARSDEDLTKAFDSLEAACQAGGNPKACYLLGMAYESGRGRPRDVARATQIFQKLDPGNGYVCKALARIALSGEASSINVRWVGYVLTQFSKQGDAEASWYVAYMAERGVGMPQDTAKAREFMQRACDQGEAAACEALTQPALPPYRKPVMRVPGWSSAYAQD